MSAGSSSSTDAIAWGSAAGGRTLAQRVPWLWYEYVVSRVPVPLWVLSCLVFAVVYGQFHYAVDAVAGLLVAAAVLSSLGMGVRRVERPALEPTTDLGSPTLPL